MISFLLACTHQPIVLYPSPVPRVDLGPLPPSDGPTPVVLDAGDTAPDVGLLVSADDWSRVKTRSRLLEVSTDALRVCYDGRELDRAHAQQWSDDQHAALLEQRRETRALRLAVPAAALLGGIIGAGVAVGVAWGLPR